MQLLNKSISTTLALCCVIGLFLLLSCEKENEGPDFSADLITNPEVIKSKEWLLKELTQSEVTKKWEAAYTPTFDWQKAQLFVNTSKDTIIEVPYISKKKYKYGVGPYLTTNPKDGISKYIEPQATRLAISLKKGAYQAQLMHLFSDTLFQNGKKIVSTAEMLQNLAFANSSQSSPKYAVLIAYAGFDESMKSFKYFERGKVRSEGNVIDPRNLGKPSLRETCEWFTVATYHQACVEVGGYSNCEPYWTYDYVLSCSPDGGDPYDSSPYGDEGGSGGESSDPAPGCQQIYDPQCRQDVLFRVSNNPSSTVSHIWADIKAEFCINSQGNKSKDIYVFVGQSVGGNAQINSKNVTYLNADRSNSSCNITHWYNVTASIVLRSYQYGSPPVTRSNSIQMYALFWGR